MSISDTELEILAASGPHPFITRRVYQWPDRSIAVWSSRHFRKRLVLPEARRVLGVTKTLLASTWLPHQLNWWIGVIFAIGASLFSLASFFSLSPPFSAWLSVQPQDINRIYFAGSIPFTIAAYLQLFQSANVGEFPDHKKSNDRIYWVGFRPGDVGWLSCLAQFVGTIFFNFNTYDAMTPSQNWLIQDLLIWLPNILGSILFQISGYLAFIETCHGYWSWQVRSTSWWIVFTNLLGCVGFLTAAVLSIVLPDSNPDSMIASAAVAFTLQGALCFLVGSLLMLPESVGKAA